MVDRRHPSFPALLICVAASAGCDRPTDSSAPTDSSHAVASPDPSHLGQRYAKREVRIPMRDGKHLFTAIYEPRDNSRTYPILLLRTPYGARPYGPDAFPSRLGPGKTFAEDGYIFVYQDVRGCFMSEGEFENMRPVDRSGDGDAVDETTDTYDTVSWLLDNVDSDNGRVGLWGVSYPGFYAAEALINTHPAVKAVSPQAPIADWYFDDFHHHGAFFLPHAFNFLAIFGPKRKGLHEDWGDRFDHGTPDGYQFFLDLGPLRNANERHFHGRIPFWNDIVEHPNYDPFWKRRSILPYLEKTSAAVLTVGGWFDAEDLYGPLQIHRTLVEHNPQGSNTLVMGPWSHGGWLRTKGDHLGNVSFEGEHSDYYQSHIVRPFFDATLQRGVDHSLPGAVVFETGTNTWRTFDTWPPEDTTPLDLYFAAGGSLLSRAPEDPAGHDTFTSDPAKPVPYSLDVSTKMTKAYMTDDQRFASYRNDVLTYATEPLLEDIVVAGPIETELWVSTTGSDADWVVKLIDVFPGDAPDHDHLADGVHMGGYQMMVRSEVFRGRFRNGYDRPKPFEPGVASRVNVPLQDVYHRFCVGHRIMVQIQSTWFPLVDRNPQRYVDNIFEATEQDFIVAEHTVHRSAVMASKVTLPWRAAE